MLHADPSSASIVTSALEAIAASGLVTMATGSGPCGEGPSAAELDTLVNAVREANTVSRGPVDLTLATAAVNAMQTHTLTPLIKEELKINIQKKRLAAGKPELTVEFKEPRDMELSEADIRRRQRRKERNRLAAQKCRTKKREITEQLEQECSVLNNDNEDLQAQIDQLQRERLKLQQIIEAHNVYNCPLGSVSSGNHNNNKC